MTWKKERSTSSNLCTRIRHLANASHISFGMDNFPHVFLRFTQSEKYESLENFPRLTPESS